MHPHEYDHEDLREQRAEETREDAEIESTED